MLELVDAFIFLIILVGFLYLPGNAFSVVPKSRIKMIMSEKPTDGAVAMHIGEIEDNEYIAAEDYLPTLPNAVSTNCTSVITTKFSIET